MNTYHWSKEKCGNPLLLVTKYDLTCIIEEEFYKFYMENPDYLKWAYENRLKRKLHPLNFGLATNRVLTRVKSDKIGGPFKYLNNKDLSKCFWKHLKGRDKSIWFSITNTLSWWWYRLGEV